MRVSFEPADIVNEVMSFGSPTPIEIVVSGPKMADNRAFAEKLYGIGQLAGGVAHEINNPLAGILAFTQLLMREVPKDGSHWTFLQEIEESALRCKKIVESLLKFARRSPGTERDSVDLNEVLRSTLFLVEHQYQLKNVTIERAAELLQIRRDAGPAQKARKGAKKAPAKKATKKATKKTAKKAPAKKAPAKKAAQKAVPPAEA